MSRARVASWCFALSFVAGACAHRPKDVLAPESARTLSLSIDTSAAPSEARGVALGARGPYFLTPDGALVAGFQGGARGDLPAGRHFVQALEVRALDGAGAWLLARDDAGSIVRLRGGGGLEAMNARLGLPPRVKSIGAAGVSLLALADEGLFVVEPKQIARYAAFGDSVAGSAGGRAVVVAGDAVTSVDLGERKTKRYPLEAPRAAILTAVGTLFVATAHGLYRENGSGELVLRYVAEDELRALAADGDTAWFVDGARLGAIDAGGLALAAPASEPIDALAVSASALWVVSGGRAKHLLRPTDVWSPALAAVVRTKCGACHATGEGAGGVSLASPADFRGRAADARRVLTTGAMPPAESREKLSTEERAQLLDWLDPRTR